eukprot:GGOE01056326.1.p2 GENE.GGOE01056326.1~~GGOE01056326.1.p2  ORF type:complete len:221 (-),score=92.35 GGOE01056326.1:211-852(-)
MSAAALFEEGMQLLKEAHRAAFPDNGLQGPDAQLVAKATALLKQAAEADPQFGPAQAQYGLSLLTSAGDDDSAFTAAAGHLEQALQCLEKPDPMVQIGYGDALFALGRVPEALEQYEGVRPSEHKEQLNPVIRHRLHVRQYFANLALCRATEAREAFQQLPPNLAPLLEALVQLEKASAETPLDAPLEGSTSTLRQRMLEENVKGWRLNFHRF